MHSPKMPAQPSSPAPPPTPPTVDQAQADVDAADALRRRRGRASDVLAPLQSAPVTGNATKTLTG